MYVPPHAARALAALEDVGWESYVVGGCVRDSLLGREPNDWDICTAAPPEAVKRCFAAERLLETGLRHGTLTLLTENGPLEITTFRREGGYSDARHPDSVDFIDDVREDLRRRDFTVNAMAYSPRRGLRDDFGGERDLAAGILRCVGVPEERLREDALRILRALRFAARYGFTIENTTAAALRAERGGLKNVSAERIYTELCGVLRGKYAPAMLRDFPEIFRTVLPELPAGDLGVRAEKCPAEPALRFAALFRGYGEAAETALRRLRADNATRERASKLADCAAAPLPHDAAALRRTLAALGESTVRDWLTLCPDTEAEALLERVLAQKPCLSVKELAVGGGDLLAAGFPAGAVLGRTLNALLEEVLDGKTENTCPALLARAAEIKEEML